MEPMLKIAVGAVAATLCAVALRKNGVEFTLLIVLAAGIGISSAAVNVLGEVLDTLSRLVRIAKLENGLVRPVVKVVGLSVITRVAGESCRGAGESGIAAFVEVAGVFFALAAAVPLVEAVVEMLAEMLI